MQVIDVLRRVPPFLWGLVGIASLISIVALAPFVWSSSRPTQTLERVYASPFQLIDHEGRTVTESNFLGKPSAWFYGFTHCPDVCPTALAEMTSILEALGPDADNLNVIFVSVDPERDTPEVLKDYVGYFDSRIVGLTGSSAQVADMARARYIFFEKVPLEGTDYAMEHEASIQLVSAEGAFFGTLATEEGFRTKMAKVRRLINNS